MKTIAAVFAFALAGTVLTGCHTTAGTTVVLNHDNGQSLICEGNTRLR